MVHEKTLEAYEKANFPYEEKPHDIAERVFNMWTKHSGRDPRVIVNRITRVKTPKNEKGQNEFITWSEKRVGNDHVGNEKTFTEDRMGEYDLPIFQSEWDTNTNMIKAIQVERYEKRYTNPYSKEEIERLYKKADETVIKFYVQVGTARYGINVYEDFRDGKIDDLVELGKSDKYSLKDLYRERGNENKLREINNKEEEKKIKQFNEVK